MGFGKFIKDLQSVVPEGEEPTYKAVYETLGIFFPKDVEKTITDLDKRTKELDTLWQDKEVVNSALGSELSAEKQKSIRDTVRQYEGTFMGRLYFYSRLLGKKS